MTIGKSIRIFLPDAVFTGIKYAELVNWTGQAIACPRNRLKELKKWPEFSKPGIYFLFESKFTDIKPKVYIGESEDVVKRIEEHVKDEKKDFWSEVVIFTGKDENLTKAHIKYIESILVSLSNNADRYELKNSNFPTRSSLPRADCATMEEFIVNIRTVLGTLGYSVLEPILKPEIKDEDDHITDSIQEYTSSSYNLFFTIKGACSNGRVTDEGFVVKKYSKIVKNKSVSMPHAISSLKDKLLSDGTLKEELGFLVTQKDILFSSSSGAAAFVAGSSRSGPTSWRSENGKTLKEIENEDLNGDT